jgi:ATP-dependent helicase/nuclease subunit A
LTISCPPLKTDKGSFVEMLERVAGELSPPGGQGSISLGEGRLAVQILNERWQAPKRFRGEEKKPSLRKDWSDFVRQWEERNRRYEVAQNKPLFVSPTALKRRAAELTERFGEKLGSLGDGDPLVVGNLAHGFLETLDFSASPEKIQKELTHYIQRQDLLDQNWQSIQRELSQIFAVFLRSKVFAEFSSANILGREVPLLVPWNGQIMEGVIDLIYERKGLLYIADYKSDRIMNGVLRQVREGYRYQAQIYSRAVQESLQREVAAFKLVFLRAGEAIEIKSDWKKGELFLTTS